LAVTRDEDIVWAWLGSRREIEMGGLQNHLSATWPPEVALALGEPGEGPSAWRLTHHQASAALAVALRSPEPLVRYADVALLAAILEDDLLATSLRRLYLKPLEAERDGGEMARETLRAYFAGGSNISSAAVALGVSRQAVAKRLRAVEEMLSRSLDGCAAELEAALRIEHLETIAADVL
jgi:DNA-binding PucR family transcriptional regulator